MTKAIVGIKVGMTRLFTDAGTAIPVTVVQCEPNKVAQVKNLETDGYAAIQVSLGSQKPQRLSKSLTVHYKAAGLEAGRSLHEIRLEESELDSYKFGSELKVDLFEGVKFVDVTGTSIGKGFAGTIKRHNFAGQRASHGNSRSHRVPGSIGQNQSPGRVFKGKKMTGHMGNERVTTLNLDLVKIDVERNLLLIKGAIPGPKSGKVIVRAAIKK